MSEVLVLNASYEPLSIVSVKRAVILLLKEKAELVEAAEAQLRAENFTLPRPLVIRLVYFVKIPQRVFLPVTRRTVLARDHYTCQYCGHAFDRKDLNLDHVIPRDRGGPTTWENIVCSCIECNTRKANRTPQEAGMHLVKKPKRPKWRPFVQINFSLYQHDSWKHFVDLAYWNVELGEDVA